MIVSSTAFYLGTTPVSLKSAMRTVDPELWSKKVKGRKIALARPLRFGLKQSGFEARLRSSYRDARAEFWGNCSVEGVRHLVSEDTGKVERCYWLLLLVLSFLFALLIVSVNVTKLVTAPALQVSHKSTQHSVRHLHFPAIALCSYNVISKRGLDHTTMKIMDRDDNRTYSWEQIQQNLVTFGALLTLTLPPRDLLFMPYLNNLNKRLSGNYINISEFMYYLAPTCESMLVKCAWRGRKMPCSLLFAKRLTSVGYCCVFNSRYEPDDLNNPPEILDRVGEDYGLSVIIHEDSEDFAYVRRPIVGTEVLIFDGSEYPLLQGGTVRVQPAGRNETVFFELSTRTQLVNPNINYYPESWRGCRMKSPGSESRHLRSYSSCLTECKRHAAQLLCGCVPYMLQPRGETVCSINHLKCLSKYREKFLYFYPFGTVVTEALSEESEDALVCEDCIPDCGRPRHSVDASHIPFHNSLKVFRNSLSSGVKYDVNVTVLRFYYPTEDQHLYTIEGNSVWFEIFALVSSQWVGLLSVTLVTVFELVFHCTVRWRHHYMRRKTLYTNIGTLATSVEADVDI